MAISVVMPALELTQETGKLVAWRKSEGEPVAKGEVLLEVMFGANGTLHVNRVVRGLGHGLDETAIAAANKMRFKPAMRGGQPVDSTAVVHVMFQMAY